MNLGRQADKPSRDCLLEFRRDLAKDVALDSLQSDTLCLVQTNCGEEDTMSPHIVCLRCARIKQACDGGTPCGRCQRLDLLCEPKEHALRSVEGGLPTLKRAKITRTHTGCLTCKKRRRKCDEARPRCSDCRRLCLDCKYANQAAQPTASAQPAQQSSEPGSPKAVSPTYELTVFKDNVLDFDGEIVAEMFDSDDWDSLIEQSSPMIHPRIPFCASNSGSPPDSLPALSLVALSTAPSLSLDEDKSLLNHYMKVVAGVLSRRDDQRTNPYLSKILPVALQNQLVMNSVLALSASHWRKLNPSISRRGTIHQTNALQSLAQLLPNIEHDSADAALSATLLLCMIELFDGASSHWKLHLDGARRLLSAIDRRSRSSQISAFTTFYRQLYHYLDSATTISTCHPPLLELTDGNSKLDLSSPASNGRGDFGDEESLYGVPKSLFHFVDKINSLAYQRKFREDPIFENMFQASATRLEEELCQWSQDRNLGEPTLSSSEEASVKYATMAFEQALQLRLHQVVNGYSIDHEKVGVCVGNILESIQEIRYGSPLESSLTFPLVMAGSSCSTENERMIIRDRFLIMERTLGFRYIYTAHELVQRVWKQRDSGISTDDVNWAAIRYFQIPGLALI